MIRLFEHILEDENDHHLSEQQQQVDAEHLTIIIIGYN